MWNRKHRRTSRWFIAVSKEIIRAYAWKFRLKISRERIYNKEWRNCLVENLHRVNDLNQCPPSFPVPPSPPPIKSLRKRETLGTSNLFDVFVCITAVYFLTFPKQCIDYFLLYDNVFISCIPYVCDHHMQTDVFLQLTAVILHIDNTFLSTMLPS